MYKTKSVVGFVLFTVLLGSCQGANVAGNGIFEARNEVLKEALIGEWESSGDEGIQIQFSEIEKEIALKINNEDRPMFDFNCDGDIRFSFGFLNEENDSVFVAAQFKAYDMETLIYLQSPISENTLDGVISLNRKESTSKVKTQQ